MTNRSTTKESLSRVRVFFNMNNVLLPIQNREHLLFSINHLLHMDTRLHVLHVFPVLGGGRMGGGKKDWGMIDVGALWDKRSTAAHVIAILHASKNKYPCRTNLI